MAGKDKSDFDMKDLYPPSALDQIEKEEKKIADRQAEEEQGDTQETRAADPPELTLDPPIGSEDKAFTRLEIEAQEAQRQLEEAERALKYTIERSEIRQEERQSDNLKGDFDRSS
ncbi:hypothetical protein [Rhodovulum marinum]|uniref:Uncharacterized protein n=1 Tax=Rhodovulum marinum TaxID=320662 RepID=A0A4R2PV48_9RHOB|nr:hypothetical protein [Rhodovulum marinum]TCP38071.1 hypothetical protein EV662_12215 [Rhodovulum marinum]